MMTSFALSHGENSLSLDGLLIVVDNNADVSQGSVDVVENDVIFLPVKSVTDKNNEHTPGIYHYHWFGYQFLCLRCAIHEKPILRFLEIGKRNHDQDHFCLLYTTG